MKKAMVTLLTASLLSLGGCAASGPRYQEVGSFNEGLAPVQAANGRWGFINESQRLVIPARFEEVRDFENGRAAAKANGRWGFIDTRGRWL